MRAPEAMPEPNPQLGSRSRREPRSRLIVALPAAAHETIVPVEGLAQSTRYDFHVVLARCITEDVVIEARDAASRFGTHLSLAFGRPLPNRAPRSFEHWTSGGHRKQHWTTSVARAGTRRKRVWRVARRCRSLMVRVRDVCDAPLTRRRTPGLRPVSCGHRSRGCSSFVSSRQTEQNAFVSPLHAPASRQTRSACDPRWSSRVGGARALND
jgi:hypothetical protein